MKSASTIFPASEAIVETARPGQRHIIWVNSMLTPSPWLAGALAAA